MKTVPVCAATCLGASQVFAKSSLISNSILQDQEVHKFDKELPGPAITYRRLAAYSQRSFIRFVQFLQKEMGEEKVINLIKKATEERILFIGLSILRLVRLHLGLVLIKCDLFL